MDEILDGNEIKRLVLKTIRFHEFFSIIKCKKIM